MEKQKKTFFSAKSITFLAVLLALVIVLQVFSGFFKIGTTSLSFVLIPIVLGGMILGPLYGAILGVAFGVVVIIDALAGLDPFTLILLQERPITTVLLCLIKGTAAGYFSGLIYHLIKNKNKLVASFVAAAAAPIINTGIFILGALLMSETLKNNFVADGQTLMYFLIIVCAGVNFLIELALNLVLAPSINTVENVIEKQLLSRSK
ncbi:MAG: ECF transporter S component [Clostridia bacterium]|nr:ECF transporter S component [Clostridia bacterium]